MTVDQAGRPAALPYFCQSCGKRVLGQYRYERHVQECKAAANLQERQASKCECFTTGICEPHEGGE